MRRSERASEDAAPLSRLIESEELEQVLTAIDQLNGALREVLVMRYIQQDSYEEIAEQLGKTVHQARALCFQGHECITGRARMRSFAGRVERRFSMSKMNDAELRRRLELLAQVQPSPEATAGRWIASGRPFWTPKDNKLARAWGEYS